MALYNTTLPWVSNVAAQHTLRYTQVAYPIALLILYLVAFTVRSITTSRKDEDDVPQQPEQLGPGGKPLPKKHNNGGPKEPDIPADLDFSRPRKLLFEWLSVAVIASFIANIVVVIVHALVARKEGWWCGEAPTVCLGKHDDVLTFTYADLTGLSGWFFHGVRAAGHSHGRFAPVTNCCSLCDMAGGCFA